MTEADNFAQQSAEPVAWRWRFKEETNWTLYRSFPPLGNEADVICEPLFTRSPAESDCDCPVEESKACDLLRQQVAKLRDQLEESRLHRLGLEEQLADTVKLVEGAAETERGACADLAEKYNDCGGDFIAQKIRDRSVPSTNRQEPA